jgi:hypothetical protein
MEIVMQDNDSTAAPPASDAPPSSHDHMNRPGMTNGVPDQLSDAQATAVPHDDRQHAETAASKDGDDPEGGAKP